MLSILSIAAAQCPTSGIVCAIGNCCGKYYDCYGGVVHNNAERPVAVGTNCKNNDIVLASDCGACTPFAAEVKPTTKPPAEATTKPIVNPTKAPTSAPTKAADPTKAPTSAPVAPTKAPVAPTSAPVAPTTAPTAAPVAPTKAASSTGDCVAIPNRGASDQWCRAVNCDAAYVDYCQRTGSSGTPATAAPTVRPPPADATTKPTPTKTPIVITQAPSNPTTVPGCKLSDVFSYSDYKALFPNANGGALNHVSNQHAIFNYSYLLDAASRYPAFACTGDVATRKREVAAFLAHTSQETSGWWAGQPYNWGFYFSTELGCDAQKCAQYCEAGNTQYPCRSGQGYYGRGPIQLSWNYNYGQVSQELFNSDVLLTNPDKIFEEGGTAFLTALWFWMTPQNPKPSCHDVMSGAWNPSSSDSSAGRKPGFGMTTNIINGGIECGRTTPQQVINRIGYYNVYANHFGVSVGDNVECATMRSY